MYFFLSSLSFLEAGFSSNIIPCLLVSLATGNKTISFLGCFVQLLIFSCLGGTECLLLAGMSYDWYLAICHPLHYASYMNPRSAFLVAFASWAVGFVVPSCTVIMTFLLPFCGPCEINHFFCDLTALLKLSCADNQTSWVSRYGYCCSHITCHIYLDCHIICVCYSSHAVDPIHHGEEESFFNLYLTPHCGLNLLWGSDLHVHDALKEELPRFQKNLLSDLHSGDSYVQSYHLQPEECRGERCLEKGCQENVAFSQKLTLLSSCICVTLHGRTN